MRSERLLLCTAMLVVASAGCGGAQSLEDRASFTAAKSSLLTGGGCPASGLDGDRDGIDDGVENCLLQRFAPIVHLADGNNFNSPWNVDSYLQNSELTVDHRHAPDCEVKWGPTQDDIANASHPHKSWSIWQGWHHTSDIHYATSKGDFTRFQITGNPYHNPSYPGDWVTYGHVYANNIGGVSLGYWFFYAWNDGTSIANHEGDWETINVVLDASFNVNQVIFFSHGHPYSYPPSQVAWTGSHPETWSAAGSHADYVSGDRCNNFFDEAPLGGHPCNSTPEYRWYTWAGGQAELGYPSGLQGRAVVNAGEIGAPLNGQSWVNYRDMWGGEPYHYAAGPYTPGSDGPTGSVTDDWSINAGVLTPQPSGCGEATCVPAQAMYVSHFSGPGCTGGESYYLPYDGYAYLCRTWDGKGECGTAQHTVTNYSARINGEECQDLWPSGNTLSQFVTVWRDGASNGGCGEYTCNPNQGMYVSHFSGPSCTGTESYYLPYDGFAYDCRSWDGAGQCGTVPHTVTNYSARINGGPCQDLWPGGNQLDDFVTIYR
jgi:hypothetical protein